MSSTNFSTPKKQNPNPHPYAIKTTSTALLSRNSSSSTPSTAHNYIPPSSPSPSPTQTGFGGERRYSRHRYSRSLTSELPRPLPAPPSATAPGDDDDTPRRRVQRTYSLPQEIEIPEDPKRWTPAEVSMYLTANLNAGGGHDLPTPVARDIATFVRDKKITGKSFLRLNEVDLEEYGINQLWRTTLVNASRALRRNVLQGRIWGNHTDQHDGNGNGNDDDDDDNNLSSSSSLSSNSNISITNRQRSLSTTSENRGRVRDMIDTLERSSSASSSELDEEGSCTISSDGRRNKDKSSKRDRVPHHRHRSLEQQQQQQGRLPQRGSVNNLFGASGPDTPSQSEREIEDKDNTITAHARRNVNGNEPRLLPFPPTGTNHQSHGYAHLVTPSHTGVAFPLPPSPDHAQNQPTTPYYLDSNHVLNTQPLSLQQQHYQQPYFFPSYPQPNHTPAAVDYYELGFKNALPISSSPGPSGPPVRSPNSQRYVVQHNPHSVQSSTPGGSARTGGSTGRLLPYPPIVGEAELFHPRPRMGLGVGGLADGLADGFGEDREIGEAGRGREDESAYCSALESQTESVASESEGGGTIDGSEEGSAARSRMKESPESGFGTEVTAKEDGDGPKDPEKVEEEPSIQDLLLVEPQPQPHTISGVEAWEMELGETVKRISNTGAAAGLTMSVGTGSKARTRPRKKEVLMGEIGRKSGRAGAGLDGKEGGRRITGVLNPGLFEAPDQAESAGDGADGGSIDDKYLNAGSIPLPDSSPSASTSAIISRESILDERESTIAGRESSLDIRESSIVERESVLTGRELLIAERESSLDIRESSIAERESTITGRESAVTADKSEIQQRITDLEKRELDVSKRESEVQKWEQEVSEREIKVEGREDEVKEWYEGKLVEIEMVLKDIPPPIATSTSTSTPASTSITSKTTVQSKWPASPIDFARRLCATFLLPVLGEERTPGFLLRGDELSRVDECTSSTTISSTSATTTTTTSTPPASSTTPSRPVTPPLVPSWTLKRDFFLNRVLVGGGSYFVLMSIGICVVLLRGFVRRILGGRR
ncbi:hypothetical protein BYT27DRAFT_7176555 [Phlegmacium glaucopus]|nr:hypothetical protein BYT27DRAFT_7176555 [Phlegmacium glaucopus]